MRPRPSMIRRLLPALLVLAAAPARAADASPWETALGFDYNTAAGQFARLHQAAPGDANLAVGYASALLARQPRTEANIRQAAELLQKAADSAPSDSEERRLALYLLARVEHNHLTPPRMGSARARYERLLAEHPGSRFADWSAVQLAFIAFGEQTPGGPDPVIARVSTLLETVRDPEARRELHTLLGNLYWREKRDAPRALEHFIAALDLDSRLPTRLPALNLVIAGIAAEAGDTPLALEHYRAFVARTPRDIRASTVRNLIATLEASAPPAASP